MVDGIEGTVWRHPKGGLRRVICVARTEESGVTVVVTQSVETGRYYTMNATSWVMMRKVGV